MSAAEKLRALDAVMTPRPWLSSNFDIGGEQIQFAHGQYLAALPLIADVVEAAEIHCDSLFDPSEKGVRLRIVLAGLDEALT